MEMTLKNLGSEGKIDHQDFLDRVDLLRTLGHPVLISNYGEFHRLSSYLFRFTKCPIGLVMGLPLSPADEPAPTPSPTAADAPKKKVCERCSERKQMAKVTTPSGAVHLQLEREGWLQPWARLRDNENDERARLAAMPAFAAGCGRFAFRHGARASR